jgi:hypothetical protein
MSKTNDRTRNDPDITKIYQYWLYNNNPDNIGSQRSYHQNLIDTFYYSELAFATYIDAIIKHGFIPGLKVPEPIKEPDGN